MSQFVKEVKQYAIQYVEDGSMSRSKALITIRKKPLGLSGIQLTIGALASDGFRNNFEKHEIKELIDELQAIHDVL